MNTRLSINLNKVALVRNSRQWDYPNFYEAAKTCLNAGCHGITVHPRPDQRHVRPEDVLELYALIQTFPHAVLNIEGNPFQHTIAAFEL